MEKEQIETLTAEVEAENDLEVSSAEEEQAAEEVEEDGELEEQEEVDQEETERKPNKGYSQRVRELNEAKKAAEEKARRLEEEANSLAARLNRGVADNVSPSFNQPMPVQPIINPGEEIDAVEFERRMQAREARILQQAESLATLRSKQAEAINRISLEAEKALEDYPELDPKSKAFNKELSDAIVTATESYVMRNPYSANVKSYVDKLMRPLKGAVANEVGNVSASLAKQVSQAATKPTSVHAKEKPANEKSIAELEAELGIIQA